MGPGQAPREARQVRGDKLVVGAPKAASNRIHTLSIDVVVAVASVLPNDDGVPTPAYGHGWISLGRYPGDRVDAHVACP
jgi:hypothetical protein